MICSSAPPPPGPHQGTRVKGSSRPIACEFSPARRREGEDRERRTGESGTGLGSAQHQTSSRLETIPGAPRRALGRFARPPRVSERRGAAAATAPSTAAGPRAPGAPPPPPPPPRPAGPLTEQQQLDLARRLLAILAEVPVYHLTPLHRRLVLGAQRAAHCARSESLPPLPSSPTRCLKTQVNVLPGRGRSRAFAHLATLATPPPPTPETERGKRRSEQHRAALPAARLRSRRCFAPSSPRFEALGTAPAALPPVAAQQPLEAPRSSASARRRGPAPPRPPPRDHSPSALPRTCPRTAPLGRARAPRAARAPKRPASSPYWLPRREWNDFLPFTHTQGSVRTCLPLRGAGGRVAKVGNRKVPVLGV